MQSKYVQLIMILIGVSTAFDEISLKIDNQPFLLLFSKSVFTSELKGKNGESRPLGSVNMYWYARNYYSLMEEKKFGVRYFVKINQTPEYTLVKDLLSNEQRKTNSPDLGLNGVCKTDGHLDFKFESVKLNTAENCYDTFYLLSCEPADKQESKISNIQEKKEENYDRKNPNPQLIKPATNSPLKPSHSQSSQEQIRFEKTQISTIESQRVEEEKLQAMVVSKKGPSIML
jgi:hypothetical protein